MSAANRRARLRWRHWFRVVHRDVGYVAVALTIAYAVSGIALNHAEDWNPKYSIETRDVTVGPVPEGARERRAEHVMAALDLEGERIRGAVDEVDHRLRVFFAEGDEVVVDTRTGIGEVKRVRRRPVFYEVNVLHLNELRGAWTYVADVFSVALILLALTGMTMMKGDRGLAGRGKYFVLAGLAVPVGFIVYLYG